jgi:CheY-specific phosphatase CheX
MSETVFQDGIERLLAEAAEEVLETMFFTSVFGPAEPSAADFESPLLARLSFRGSPPGVFWLSVPRDTARSITANFLGAEQENELSDSQVGNVIGELANVICGAVLSRLESDAAFELEAPELVNNAESFPFPGAIRRPLELESGTLTVFLATDCLS